jgi:hypothetical protein
MLHLCLEVTMIDLLAAFVLLGVVAALVLVH